ncbi:MAG TPA: FHA domain-containing protein [Bacteriovoracaceae bacterium]|nr:FHA domain-containing protein [Bacteriovoracaceae bacterium]
MRAKLKLLNGQDMQLHLSEGSYMVGRSPKCDVIITQEGMSRKHCKLEIDKDEVFVTDLGSTNGVMIDGVKLKPYVRTEFKTYLALSFGAVTSLKIEPDRSKEPSLTFVMPRPETNLMFTKTHTLPLSATDKTTVLKMKVLTAESEDRSQKRKFIVLNTLALLLLLGVAALYYTSDTKPIKYDLTVKDTAQLRKEREMRRLDRKQKKSQIKPPAKEQTKEKTD